MSQAEILEKIKKLLALATSPNEHEAKLAAQRASELMEKYQIDEAEVLLKAEETKSDPIVEELYTVPNQKMKLNWIGTLGHASAILFDGTTLIDRGLWGTRFRFVGHKSDIEPMKMMFEHLYRSWFSIVESDLQDAKDDNELSSNPRTWTPSLTMKFKSGHGLAFSMAISSRCAELALQRKRKVEASSNTGTALILVKGQALNEWKQMKGVRNARVNHSAGNYLGRQAGQKAGKNIALGGAIGSGAKQLNQ